MGAMPVSAEDLRRFLQGHRVAGARLRQERLRRVAALTVDAARAEYESLCRTWERFRALGDDDVLDQRAVQERVRLRRRLSGRR